MIKQPTKNILVSVPVPLLKKLDISARKQMRSRTKEVCLRLELSLKASKTISTEVTS
jgi:hypothetical protein